MNIKKKVSCSLPWWGGLGKGFGPVAWDKALGSGGRRCEEKFWKEDTKDVATTAAMQKASETKREL